MTKIGLVLMLVCAIAGGMFHFWISPQEAAPEAIAFVPIKPTRASEKNKPATKHAVDYNPYMADLQRRIKKRWFPPNANESDKIKVVFKVHSDGSISNLRTTKASKLPRASQAALNAVQKASPFRPLPKGAPNDVDIQFTFDYKVFKN